MAKVLISYSVHSPALHRSQGSMTFVIAGSLDATDTSQGSIPHPTGDGPAVCGLPALGLQQVRRSL